MKKLKNRIELAKYFNELKFQRGAEIGVEKGYYSKVLLDNILGLVLFSIDPYINPKKRHWADHKKASALLLPYPYSTIIKKTSMDAVKDFEDNSLDFVYIDALHDYYSVKEDIEAWVPKVRSGGIVSGHDYYVFGSGQRGVIDAVDEYVKKHGYELQATEWDRRNPVKDDRQPSWWFFKTH